jgi:hypothetical protein
MSLLLMNVEHYIRTSVGPDPGFSRIRRSRQYAAAEAGIQPAKAGTPVSYTTYAVVDPTGDAASGRAEDSMLFHKNFTQSAKFLWKR